jgi:hypothetical protein
MGSNGAKGSDKDWPLANKAISDNIMKLLQLSTPSRSTSTLDKSMFPSESLTLAASMVKVAFRNASAVTVTVDLPDIALDDVALWWPHTHGFPYLYKISLFFVSSSSLSSVSAEPADSDSLLVDDIISFRYGIRKIEGYIDPKTKGQAFRVNNVPIFLVGGNWIATDQFLRFSRGDEPSVRRYMNEVRAHREMGLNLIRVWGGGLTERSEFYDACDEQGVLVFQEVNHYTHSLSISK